MKSAAALLSLSYLSLLMSILLTATLPSPATAAKTPTFENIKDLVWDGKQFVAVGQPALVIKSSDGVKWIQSPAGRGNELFTSIAWGNGSYAMIARYKGRDCTFISQDALDWKRNCPEILVDEGINRLRWVAGHFVAVGKKGLILVSEDGEQWKRMDSGTSENLIGVVGDKGHLLIIGQDGLVLKGAMNSILKVHQQPKLQFSNANEFHSPKVANVAWSGREFVTVGDTGYGSIFARSEDGENWDLKFFSGFNRLFSDITWGNGLFVAVGTDIAVSPDGLEWQFLNLRREQDGSSISLMHILAGGGRFLTTGLYGGNAFLSYDGFTWRGATKVPLAPSGITILPNKLAEARPIGEKNELVREKVVGTFSQLLITFGVSGGSLLLFGYLQFKAIRRMRGGWLLGASLPLIAGVGVVVITVYGFLTESNLWPIGLIFLMPPIIMYLGILLLLHKRFCKQESKRQMN